MSKLANISKQRIDPIVNAENEHERRALNCRLSPLAEFVIENVQLQLGVSFTAAGSQLLEAACADWLEINGHDTTSETFKAKYLEWLNSFSYSGEDVNPQTGQLEATRSYVTL